jgi:hypothetical protein
MSRVRKLIRLVRDNIRLLASEKIEQDYLDRDIAALVQMDDGTLSSWLTGRNTPAQFVYLLGLLDYLPPDKVAAIFQGVLEFRELKNAVLTTKIKKKRTKKTGKKAHPRGLLS